MEKPGLLLGRRNVFLSVYLLRYTLFGLLDTFFLGGVEFQRMEPCLSGF